MVNAKQTQFNKSRQLAFNPDGSPTQSVNTGKKFTPSSLWKALQESEATDLVIRVERNRQGRFIEFVRIIEEKKYGN